MVKIFFGATWLILTSGVFAQGTSDPVLPRKCLDEVCAGHQGAEPLYVDEGHMRTFVNGLPNQLGPVQSAQIEAGVDRDIVSLRTKLEKVARMDSEALRRQLRITPAVVGSLLFEACGRIIDATNDPKVFVQCPGYPQTLENEYKSRIELTYRIRPIKGKGFFYRGDADLVADQKLLIDQHVGGAPADRQGALKRRSSQLVARLENFSSLKESQRNALLEDLRSFHLAANPDLKQMNADCSSEACLGHFLSSLDQPGFRANLSAQLGTLVDPAFRQSAVEVRKLRQTMALNAPSAEEQADFEGQVSGLKSGIIRKMEAIMSPESHRVYAASLRKVSIKLEEITAAALEAEEDPNLTTLASNGEPDTGILEMVQAGGRDGVFNKLVKTKSKIGMISDVYKHADRQISYSLFSIKYPAQGLQTMTHEIGHHLSRLHEDGVLSGETELKIQAVKDCIANRYRGFRERTGVSAGKLFLQEEFADEFLFNFAPASNIPNMCEAYLGVANGIHATTTIELDDGHPAIFWRVLNHLRHGEKPLPDSCQEVVRTDPQGYVFAKCF